MGYTHYWTNSNKKSTTEQKVNVMRVLNKCMELKPNIIEINDVTDNDILCNGIDENSHETMVIDFTGSGNWAFCKTAKKPYDDVVVAMILYCKKIGIIESWSSDGRHGDHTKGRELLDEVLYKLEHDDSGLLVTNSSLITQE